MLLVITGAGASASVELGVGTGRPKGLPLTNELIQPGAYGDAYPYMMQIVPQISRAIASGNGLEEVLEKLANEGADDPIRARQVSETRQYIRERIRSEETKFNRGATIYIDMFERVRRWAFTTNNQFCVATFNYDTLQDIALTRCDMHTFDKRTAEGIPTPPCAGYFKLHGSTDWQFDVEVDAQETRTEVPEGLQNAQIGGFSIGGGTQITGRSLNEVPPSAAELASAKLSIQEGKIDRSFRKAQDLFYQRYPAIAIPVAFKDDSMFVVPKSDLQKLVALLPKVEKVLVIGWRAMESHFLRLLESAEINPTTMLVCRNGGATAQKALEEIGWNEISDTGNDCVSFLDRPEELERFLHSRF